MSKWSAIVYTRTYEVDFRFIAIPKYFNDQGQEWALNYILGTTRSTGSLEVQPRWSLFKNDKYCVIGVTCPASDLIKHANLASEDRTKDYYKRGLFAFVGYVTQLNQEDDLLSIPSYTGKNLELFKPLYEQYVCNADIWFVKSYEKASKEAVRTNAQELTYPEFSQPQNFSLQQYQLQTNKSVCSIFPDSETNRENLWFAAVQRTRTDSNQSLSLCLGLSTQSEVFYSPFGNATALDVTEPIILQKTKPVDNIKPVETEKTSQKVNGVSQSPVTQKNTTSKFKEDETQNQLNPLAIVATGTTMGGLVGWKLLGFMGLIPGGVLGGGIGWLATNFLINDSNTPTTRIEEQLSDNDDYYSESEEDRNSVKNDYGFNPKNKSKNLSNSEPKKNNKSNWF